MSTTKRFIAGAVCPRCGEMDKLRTYANEEGTFKECVHCDFEEKQLAQVEVKELDTRVNQVSDGNISNHDASQVIKIVTPKKE